MPEIKSKNPLHGITLEMILNSLTNWYTWPELSDKVKIKCFTIDPSIKSSLVFLRRTPWARKKVENLFIYGLKKYGQNKE